MSCKRLQTQGWPLALAFNRKRKRKIESALHTAAFHSLLFCAVCASIFSFLALKSGARSVIEPAERRQKKQSGSEEQ
jgi:hypothetical protein